MKKKLIRTVPISVLLIAFMSIVLSLTLGLASAWAGPPFLTDDPEPVEYKHSEFYVASQSANDRDGVSMTAPLFEFNYGILPNTQFHLILPLVYSHPRDGSKEYGLDDMELGVKYRFIQEADWHPQVGTFPIVELPTGDSSRGLGEPRIRVFIPLWLQKSWGPWTTYGGGGYWHNPGTDNKNYWFFGWEVQREISKMLTLGAEVFHSTKKMNDGTDRTGFNIGAIVNLTEEHHILFSAGRDFHGNGDNLFSMYVAYQWTFGKSK